jgi:hypothetical protein
MLSEKEKQEWSGLADSVSLRDDARRLKESLHNPFIKDGAVDIDRYINFLNEYNEFINQRQKTFKPIIERIMKL